MVDPGADLRTMLTGIRRRTRNVRSARLAGRGLLAYSLLLLALLVAREIVRGRFGIEIVPVHGLRLLLLAGGGVAVVLAAGALVPRFGGPSLPALARSLDRRFLTSDLFAAGLSALGEEGAVKEEVVRRAAEHVGTIDVGKTFPRRRNLALLVAILPIALVLVYLLGLPRGLGPLPLGGGRPGALRNASGMSAAASLPREKERAPIGPPSPKAEPRRPARRPGAPPAGNPQERDRLSARVVPAKKVFSAMDPIAIFVSAKPEGALARRHDLKLTLVVDHRAALTEDVLSVGPRPGDTALKVEFARSHPEFAGTLTPGLHRVSAVLTEGNRRIQTPFAEFRIEGGGNQKAPKPKPKPRPKPRPHPKPKPKPEPHRSSGSPPPRVKPLPRFVVPLFGPGKTVKKKGYALVPDPKAPPGTPPRRVPIEKAAREAGRQPESAVPVERLAPKDRDLVRRYFDALRGAK